MMGSFLLKVADGVARLRSGARYLSQSPWASPLESPWTDPTWTASPNRNCSIWRDIPVRTCRAEKTPVKSLNETTKRHHYNTSVALASPWRREVMWPRWSPSYSWQFKNHQNREEYQADQKLKMSLTLFALYFILCNNLQRNGGTLRNCKTQRNRSQRR